MAAALFVPFAHCGPHASSDSGMLNVFLRSTYGPAANTGSPWGKETGRERLSKIEKSVCAHRKIKLHDGRHDLLAVCTTYRDAPHANSGEIDLYVLSPRNGKLVVDASSLHESSGNFGNPGSVSFLKLGPETYGFLIAVTWYGYGEADSFQTLMAQKGKTIVDVASFDGALENLLDHENTSTAELKAEKISMKFDLSIKRDTVAAGFYPLRVLEHGIECGRVISRTWRLAFDPVSWSYRLPPALSRDGCTQSTKQTPEKHQ